MNASETRKNAGRGGCASGGFGEGAPRWNVPAEVRFHKRQNPSFDAVTAVKNVCGEKSKLILSDVKFACRVKRSVCAPASKLDEGVNVSIAEGCRGQCRDECMCVCAAKRFSFFHH